MYVCTNSNTTNQQHSLAKVLLFHCVVANAGSHPLTYHRMDVLPEATTCYHTDTLSYAGNNEI